ncbi:MAG: hypothetical protein RLZZ52_970, partial [Actinomycetota bacterium]
YRLGGGANPNGGGGGGGGWNGGQGGTAGASGGGGSNYASSSAAGINISFNTNYPAVANGYAGVAYASCPVPSAISAVTVTPNGTSASLSFPAAVDNGTPVTGYQYSLDGGTSWNSLTTSGSATKSATISSLTLSTAYSLEVRPVYLTANIVANDVSNSGPGRAVTSYVTSTTQAFTTLAQNVVMSTPQAQSSSPTSSLAQTGSAVHSTLFASVIAACVAGVSLLTFRRRKEL